MNEFKILLDPKKKMMGVEQTQQQAGVMLPGMGMMPVQPDTGGMDDRFKMLQKYLMPQVEMAKSPEVIEIEPESKDKKEEEDDDDEE
jgi:hypothetical protein